MFLKYSFSLRGMALCSLLMVSCGAGCSSLGDRPSSGAAASQVVPENIPVLVERVSRHLPLSTKETPLVAIVTNVEAAKQQSPAFYQKAQNGDRLLVWTDKAVLYSPERDEVESVLVFQTVQPPTPQAIATEKATVEIRNGTGVTGLTTVLAERLRAQGLIVSKTANARAKEVYPTSLVMNAGSRVLPASAQILANYGTAIASSTAAVEMPVAADFLIIIGANDVAKYKK